MHDVPDDLLEGWGVDTKWTQRWLEEKMERERAEDARRFPPPLTRQFDLSDVLPSVLDGTPHQWPTRGGAIRGLDGVVHGLLTVASPTTICGLWWARSEKVLRRTYEAVDCLECLAAG